MRHCGTGHKKCNQSSFGCWRENIFAVLIGGPPRVASLLNLLVPKKDAASPYALRPRDFFPVAMNPCLRPRCSKPWSQLHSLIGNACAPSPHPVVFGLISGLSPQSEGTFRRSNKMSCKDHALSQSLEMRFVSIAFNHPKKLINAYLFHSQVFLHPMSTQVQTTYP